jgi:hypothetical protein
VLLAGLREREAVVTGWTGWITEPDFYDIPEDRYHADPIDGGSLSVSGAKKLLPPSCPAIYDYERGHPKPPTAAMELGTAVHTMVLGTGQPIEVVDADSWRGKPAKEQRDAAIANGRLPMLAEDHAKAAEIAKAVRLHRLAGALFGDGDAEQSMFWRCPEFGVWKRGRLDWLTFLKRPTVVDLKTCQSAAPEEIARSVAKYHYYMQDPFYREGVEELTGASPDFLFVFVQTQQPYLVTVVQLKDEAVELGRQRCRLATEIYRDCVASGDWPGYGDDVIHDIALPRWQQLQIESEIELVYGY